MEEFVSWRLLGACALGSYALYEVFCFHRRKKLFDKIAAFEPCKEQGGWLIGNGVALAKSTDGDLQKAVLGLIKERGHGPIKIRIPGMGGAVIFSTPEVQKLSPLPKGMGYDSVKVLFGANLVTLNHEAHKYHRRIISKGFSQSALYALVPAFHQHSCNLVDALQKKSEINAHEWMVRVTFDIIADQAFGFESGCVKGGKAARMDLAEAVATTLQLTVKPWTRLVTGARLAKLIWWRTYALIDKALSQCLRDRQVLRAQSSGNGKKAASSWRSLTRGETDLLDLLLDASEGEGWSLREVQDEAFIFFLAGHETTALTLTWLLLHLGKDKASQTKLREEVLRVAPNAGVPSKDQLNSLPFMTACLQESLRLYPPASMVPRKTEAPIEIDGAVVPAGFNCLINIVGLQRTESVFPEADTWNPDRWAKNPDMAYFIPFSFGPRGCIGKEFFWLEAKTLLLTFVRAFEWDTVGEIPPATGKTGTLHPSSPAYIAPKPRTEFNVL
jgi:cytochrome P450